MASRRLRIYVDADALIAGAAGAPFGAAHVLLVGENFIPIELICAETAILEATRNVEEKLPEALPALEDIIEYSIQRVDDPAPQVEERFCNFADPKDAIHLAAATVYDCKYLTTYNGVDYEPGHPAVEVVEPGVLVKKLREVITPAVFSEGIW